MKTQSRILVVDDDPLVRQSCSRILAQKYDVKLVENGTEGLDLLEAESFDLALVDLKLPDISGMDILRRAPDSFPDTPVIMITGYSTINNAVEAIKMGASDYLAKPFGPEELEAAIEKAIRQRRILKDYRQLREALADQYRVSRLLGESAAMKRVFTLMEQVAQTDTTVLLTGESGTGKELFARAIHFLSHRKDARFVAVDCGAIAPSLIASEIFGHIRGAFTGAVDNREGLIQTADGGTLFLDEISNLPLELQTTLLRVIEDGQVRAVGTSDSVNVDVRYICATNRDLAALITEGKFREDLFYRINVFPIHLPPLRERKDDIPILARYFLSMFCARMHKSIEDFTTEAIDTLIEYEWPGNVRELSNVVERLVILCDGTRIGQAHLRESIAASVPFTGVPKTADELNELKRKLREEAVVEVEKAFLIGALRRNNYNITRAAEQTAMQRPNFQALLKKHGLRIRDIAARQDQGH
jgi:DNA-binding NtrC family response regulator